MKLLYCADVRAELRGRIYVLDQISCFLFFLISTLSNYKGGIDQLVMCGAPFVSVLLLLKNCININNFLP